MFKQIMMTIIALTLVGSLGVAIYDGAQDDESAAQTAVTETNDTAIAADSVATQSPVQDTQSVEAPQETIAPQNDATSQVGERWVTTGTIASVDDFGFELALPDERVVYVELGPPTYWQTQDFALFAGEPVVVDGFVNADNQHHARIVTKAGGEQIEVRTETGQPLWSGGASNQGQGDESGASGGHGQGGEGEAQVSADEWITLDGQITAVARNSLTVQTIEGETMAIQLGQPRFAESQGITFTANERVRIVGFWEGTQFQAGEITQLATGARLMLRDPNGRPLWGGPGRNGGSQGQGNGNNGNNGNPDSGSGGQSQESVSIGWVEVNSTIIYITDSELLVQADDGRIVTVSLAATQHSFAVGDFLTLSGFWQNDMFHVGEVLHVGTGVQITLTEATNGQGNQGQGNSFRGGRE